MSLDVCSKVRSVIHKFNWINVQLENRRVQDG